MFPVSCCTSSRRDTNVAAVNETEGLSHCWRISALQLSEWNGSSGVGLCSCSLLCWRDHIWTQHVNDPDAFVPRRIGGKVGELPKLNIQYSEWLKIRWKVNLLLWPEATNLLRYPLRRRCDLQMDMDILETISLQLKNITHSDFAGWFRAMLIPEFVLHNWEIYLLLNKQ